MIKIYDKASWHIDAGEGKDEVLTKLNIVFGFLNDNSLLSDEGEEIFDLGIDTSCSLNENMVTAEGKYFLDTKYDLIINCSSAEIADKLKESMEVYKHEKEPT